VPGVVPSVVELNVSVVYRTAAAGAGAALVVPESFTVMVVSYFLSFQFDSGNRITSSTQASTECFPTVAVPSIQKETPITTPAGVLAVPLLTTVAENVTGSPAFGAIGDQALAVATRSGRPLSPGEASHQLHDRLLRSPRTSRGELDR
jgi:hypothetical protein